MRHQPPTRPRWVDCHGCVSVLPTTVLHCEPERHDHEDDVVTKPSHALPHQLLVRRWQLPPEAAGRKLPTLPHLGSCAAPTGCMALNHYSNLTASSRACTAQMHALGYSNETRCAFLKHGETVCPRSVHAQQCDRHTTRRVQPATCLGALLVHHGGCMQPPTHVCNDATGPLANDR